MRTRRSLLTIPVLVAGLAVSGCGSAGGSNETPAASAGSGDATAILASVKPVTAVGPQKLALNVGVNLKGQLKDPTVGALLGTGPITVDLSGPVDVTGKAVDLTFKLQAGKINLAGQLLAKGDTGYVKLSDKWYELPADALKSSGTSTSSAAIDPAKVLSALGDPTKLVSNVTVIGSEDIEGIATDHVSGDVNTAEVVAAIGRVAGAVDASASPITPEQIAKATGELEKFVKSAKIDLWVGSADKQVHRVKIAAGLVLDDETKASSGIEGLDLTFALTSTPTESPSINAPDGALPAEQLSKDLLPVILSGLGSPTP